MNALKNTIKRTLGHKGIKPLSGGELKAAGSNVLNAVLRNGVKKRVHNALQNNDLLFEHAGIIIGHTESSFCFGCTDIMDVAGGCRNAVACAGNGVVAP